MFRRHLEGWGTAESSLQGILSFKSEAHILTAVWADHLISFHLNYKTEIITMSTLCNYCEELSEFMRWKIYDEYTSTQQEF